MSYADVGNHLRTYLLADTILKAYNHWVDLRIGNNDTNTRNCQYLVEIDVPDGTYIEPANKPVTGGRVSRTQDPGNDPPTYTEVNDGEQDFETYRYLITLRCLRRGYDERLETKNATGRKTIFGFCDDVRNSMDLFFKNCSAAPYSLTLCGMKYSNIDYRRIDGEGGLAIQFSVYYQEEVRLESR